MEQLSHSANGRSSMHNFAEEWSFKAQEGQKSPIISVRPHWELLNPKKGARNCILTPKDANKCRFFTNLTCHSQEVGGGLGSGGLKPVVNTRARTRSRDAAETPVE